MNLGDLSETRWSQQHKRCENPPREVPGAETQRERRCHGLGGAGTDGGLEFNGAACDGQQVLGMEGGDGCPTAGRNLMPLNRSRKRGENGEENIFGGTRDMWTFEPAPRR